MVCDDPAVETPEVAPGYWRFDPKSPDFENVKLYECTRKESCTGGNSTKHRCAIGYDDDGPLCAVCADKYVMQQDVCSHCPEYKPSSPTMPTGDLLYAGLITLFLFACGLYYYLTNDALTEEDEFLLRERLHHLDLDRLFPKTEKKRCGSR